MLSISWNTCLSKVSKLKISCQKMVNMRQQENGSGVKYLSNEYGSLWRLFEHKNLNI